MVSSETGLDALHEFHNDRETSAAVIDLLPATAQDRWFHRGPSPNEIQFQRSVALLHWLEEERRVAVMIHLNNLAKQHSVSVAASSKTAVKPESSLGLSGSTDQGLVSGVMLAQRSRDEVEAPKVNPPAGPSGPVVTAEQAEDVTARYLANLVEKKMDSCPLCKTRHFY